MFTEWDDGIPGYTTSLENKTGTRTTGLTRVLYSKSQCYKAGFPLSFRILDAGEKSPVDGLGIAVTNDDMDTMKREGAVFLACDGKMVKFKKMESIFLKVLIFVNFSLSLQFLFYKNHVLISFMFYSG